MSGQAGGSALLVALQAPVHDKDKQCLSLLLLETLTTFNIRHDSLNILASSTDACSLEKMAQEPLIPAQREARRLGVKPELRWYG